MIQIPSKRVENVVEALSRLPGIGKKSALRLALYILKCDDTEAEFLSESILRMKKETQFCTICHNISDQNICSLCNNNSRNSSVVCVVEDVRDFMAIENTGQFNGRYHILGGIISPMDGVSPDDLTIDSLINRVEKEEIKEIILALPTTVEGDTTSYFIYRKLQHTSVKITAIARGVAIGDDLEYTDEITLGRSILHRLPYDGSSKRSN
ncbi:MAG: recombination mediator RecR [Bacteroidales bacterium]|nr:recombination mediator RecR [Bacteroidales bacterium]MDD2322543.1 recombination mediator RecR [Bacteroidales bacterium]MDD3009823.1 recombination mediator RecR [Bacteroidales bacterium]MDD3961372.1 recombination mediator RecR [Bacteroidales bacterium]MDY0285213.1 recombination mediator RecR [Bacteroidales bacterium]